MILEGLVTTENADGSANISPMGPIVDADMRRLVLRPFPTSTTYANLRRNGHGVLHVTDDVELLVRAAVGRPAPSPRMIREPGVAGSILADCCRWYAFRVSDIDDREARVRIVAEVYAQGQVRDFFGFNRAKHAVVEAAILATRAALLPADELRTEFARLAPLIEKTGGQAERWAFEFLNDHVRQACSPGKVIVAAASRLHFGMFSFGQSGVRQFGGVGAMIDKPGLRLEFSRADDLTAHGPLAERAIHFARLAARAWNLDGAIGCRIEVLAAPTEHAGFGSGTQLALAVAAGMRAIVGMPPMSATELARAVGRAHRSAIGTHGFDRGGLLVEAGKLSSEDTSPLVARVALPSAWRFVLFRPLESAGIWGAAERRAFDQLPPVPTAVTEKLTNEALLRLLPAAATDRFDEFCDSLSRFSSLAGECFATVQGGPFARPHLIDTLSASGARGVGQSSWGPTVFAVAPDDKHAQELLARWRTNPAAENCEVVVAGPANQGALCIVA